MVRLAIAIAVAQLASLSTYAAYVPAPIPVWAAVAAVIAATSLALAALGRGLLRPAWVIAAAAVVTAIVAFVIYPRADALREVMRGTDQDDAVIAVATGLARGEYPFASLTYLGNPVSPGPLWALAHLPFAMAGTYSLAPVVALVVSIAMVAARCGTHAVAAMLIGLGSAPVFWAALAIGSDQFTVGCLTVVLVVLKYDATRTWQTWGAAALGLTIATARLVYPYIPALTALLVARTTGARRAAIAAAVGGVALHLAFYLWHPEGYGPVNALQRADVSLPGWWRYLAALSTLAVLAAAWRYGRSTLSDRLYWIGWCLAVPLGWMLAGRAAEQGLWIATYLVPALLPLTAGAAGSVISDQGSAIRDPGSGKKTRIRRITRIPRLMFLIPEILVVLLIRVLLEPGP